MTALPDLRLMNLHAVQQLGRTLRGYAHATLVAVVLVPREPGQVYAHAVGIGDERDCVAAADYLLGQAKELIEALPPEHPHRSFLPRITAALTVLGAPSHPQAAEPAR